MDRPVVARVLRFQELERLYAGIASAGSGRPFFQAMLDGLDVELNIPDAELSKIPRTGPCVVVANHPFGLLEGAAIMSRLLVIRDDVKVLTNELIATVPEVRDWFIPVDVLSGAAAQTNQRGLRRSLEWLRKGGLLVVFPAGEVSHLQLNRFSITDPKWHPSVGRLIRRTEAVAVPFYVHGANSAIFQVLGLLHAKVRTALLPHEFLNKKRHKLDIRIGHPITPSRAASMSSDEAFTRYLRWRTYLLGHRRDPFPAARPPHAPMSRKVLRLDHEIESLPSSRLLAETADTQVFVAAASEIPKALEEIGVLRELSFRAIGEGTGKEKDLDSFDPHYLHLFSWRRARKEIIGAYRLGQTDEILRQRSIGGLYTSTLFQYSKDFLFEIHPALEMGRSFVRPEYQKSFPALLLLWKGIGRFVVAHPRYRRLFGPVSISNEYGPLSRNFLVSYLEVNARDERLSRLVRPRKPYWRLPLPRHANWDIGLDELSEIIADLEADGKGVPVLLRQYLKLGGRLLSFNVDPKFSRCLDGLIVVDLAATDVSILNRYMGAAGAQMFLSFHRPLVA